MGNAMGNVVVPTRTSSGRDPGSQRGTHDVPEVDTEIIGSGTKITTNTRPRQRRTPLFDMLMVLALKNPYPSVIKCCSCAKATGDKDDVGGDQEAEDEVVGCAQGGAFAWEGHGGARGVEARGWHAGGVGDRL